MSMFLVCLKVFLASHLHFHQPDHHNHRLMQVYKAGPAPRGGVRGRRPLTRLSRPLTQDKCENRFYLWNIMVYLKNTVAKRIGFLALIWCYYSKNLGQSVSQSRILIVTSDTQTSRASGSTKCRHYAALLTKLKLWWNIFLMFNRGLNYRS